VEAQLQRAQDAARLAFDGLSDEQLVGLADSFDADLPEGARAAVYRFLPLDAGTWPAAEPTDLKEIASSDAIDAAARGFGHRAPRMLGIVKGRARTILGAMSADDRAATLQWVRGLPIQAQAGLLRALAGK
jgi:hypothetical protein